MGAYKIYDTPSVLRTQRYEDSCYHLRQLLGAGKKFLNAEEIITTNEIIQANLSKLHEGFEPMAEDARVLTRYITNLTARIEARAEARGDRFRFAPVLTGQGTYRPDTSWVRLGPNN